MRTASMCRYVTCPVMAMLLFAMTAPEVQSYAVPACWDEIDCDCLEYYTVQELLEDLGDACALWNCGASPCELFYAGASVKKLLQCIPPCALYDCGVTPSELVDAGADPAVVLGCTDCPWDKLIEWILAGLPDMSLAPPAGRKGGEGVGMAAAAGGRVSAGAVPAVLFREMAERLYSVRDRMTPEMRARALSAGPAFLSVLRRDPSIKAGMIQVLWEVIALIDAPDMVIPQMLRDTTVRISDSVERAMEREGVVSSDMRLLLPEIRDIARDARVRTVNEMLIKYGAGGPAAAD